MQMLFSNKMIEEQRGEREGEIITITIESDLRQLLYRHCVVITIEKCKTAGRLASRQSWVKGACIWAKPGGSDGPATV